MGGQFSNIFTSQERHKKMKKIKVVLLGLDGAGKTTIVTHLDSKAFVPSSTASSTNRDTDEETKETDSNVQGTWILPTSGMRLHRFRRSGMKWELWDMSGRSKFRSLWASLFQSAHALVFVVDTSNVLRLGVVQREFKKILANQIIRKRRTPILVLLNKGDHATENGQRHINILELEGALGINPSTKERVHFETCNGISGNGINESFGWLVQRCKDHHRTRQVLDSSGGN